MNITTSRNPINKVIDSFFNSSFSDIIGADFTDHQPAVNIIENDQSFHINLAVPGFKKEDFVIDILKDQLSISAKTENIKNDADPVHFTKREFNFSSFKRSFHLPESINVDAIDAKYEEGILKIHLEKKEVKEDQHRSIHIS